MTEASRSWGGPPHPGRPSERPRLTVGVRARILATVLVLTAIGMALAGTAFMLFERRQLVDHLDRVLAADVRQLSASAQTALAGPNPPSTVRDLLELQLNQHLPTNGEVLLALVDATPVFYTQGPFPIDAEPALLDQVTTLGPDAPTQIRQVDTDTAGPVRYVAMQVRIEGRPEVGTLVVAVSLQPTLDQLADSARLYAALSLLALGLTGIGAWIVSGRLLRPLRLLRDAAETISDTDLAARIPVTGNDDVTELTRTVNAMLDRLEDAFETQQQFLDDAGHELRTPITIVRGHLEVLDTDDPAEVQATRALVMDELDRMARLVNDLIVLAQSGRNDFVSPEAMDLHQLLRDVLDKAQALAVRNWVLDCTIHAVAVADGHRLTQAMLQLADNAVRHTDVGDTIAIGGALSRGQTQLWVRDTGTGVSEQDAKRIFERFGRAGGTRGDGGSGLGLSIVAGIAAAHGGRVTLDPTTDGTGARFTLILPLELIRRTAPPPTMAGPSEPPRTQAPADPPRIRPGPPPAPVRAAPPGESR